MKKTALLLIFTIAFCANAFAQKTLTAKQLFMSLPNEYINGTAKERATFLTFPKSIKTDFLSFMITENAVPKMIAGDFKEPQSIGDLRVFRGKSSTIVGLRYQIGDGKEMNPTPDTTKIITVLLERKGGKWMDVTESMLPKVSSDYAHKVLTENFKMNVKAEDVWVETQISKDKNGLLTVARIKGNDAVTTLKWFKWNGQDFVETEN
jgi:hypothetical protein